VEDRVWKTGTEVGGMMPVEEMMPMEEMMEG
jgi:hypothetical protein